ncbi:D-alanyl-D-alanine carboxypeptidase family protein [Paenibacillus farraposensis]|uniref:D-alanyl-D-alanine carboxypeptidase family protein n=1 Tax=Paenibacillus farraposensis TaxID=2807095 RepID=A0ABW4D7S7_9BACL|nr:M15 family metallopeptidase [Paenibacillus farraposensis]MCC3379033.1 D-alanyl-D-alanine carboxypeptidase family protein [Paenibacillus farraposensis]
MKRHIQQARTRQHWGKVLIPGLILPGLLLAACQQGGSGGQESEPLKSSTTVQENAPSSTQPGTADSSTGTGQASTGTESGQADAVMAIRSQNALQATVKEEDGTAVVTNAEADMVVVNKKRSLPIGYVPGDLVEPQVPFSFEGPHEKRQMRKEAANALEKLFAGAQKDGIELRAVSGYRSYKRQVSIFNNNVKTKGQAYASQVSAVPGTSEHQTGLAIDVSSPSVGNALEQTFGASKEGKWLAKHAPEYGFIIRYMKGKEDVTGYVYEPWHIRYVGEDIAEDVTKQGLTLEEYFGENNIKL